LFEKAPLSALLLLPKPLSCVCLPRCHHVTSLTSAVGRPQCQLSVDVPGSPEKIKPTIINKGAKQDRGFGRRSNADRGAFSNKREDVALVSQVLKCC